jgi:hypothetical protein
MISEEKGKLMEAYEESTALFPFKWCAPPPQTSCVYIFLQYRWVPSRQAFASQLIPAAHVSYSLPSSPLWILLLPYTGCYRTWMPKPSLLLVHVPMYAAILDFSFAYLNMNLTNLPAAHTLPAAYDFCTQIATSSWSTWSSTPNPNPLCSYPLSFIHRFDVVWTWFFNIYWPHFLCTPWVQDLEQNWFFLLNCV